MSPRIAEWLRATSPTDRFILIVLVVWLAWVTSSALWSGRSLSPVLPYLVAPVAVVGGVAAGRLLAPRSRRWRVPELGAVVALVVLVAVPFYPNARGAMGVQLVALAGLIVLANPLGARADARAARSVAAVAAIVLVGVLLAARSDAAAILVVVLAIAASWVVARGSRPRRWFVVGAGVGAFGCAAVTVALLGSRDSWPGVLNASLSGARHTLWSDALRLWAEHPMSGAGPGSFTESSELASSDRSLAMAHSSILQVGAELGLVGALLFAALFIGGLLMATQGSGPAVFIGAAAWTILGVHSMIDHLYEFPAVTLTAGIVLGWASTLRAEPAVQVDRG